MRNETKISLTVAGLVACGFLPVPAKTRKYQVFGRKKDWYQFMVGKGGSLRLLDIGQPINKSFSMTDLRVHKVLMKIGQAAINHKLNEVDPIVRRNEALVMFDGLMGKGFSGRHAVKGEL